jgi:hypothetical protein
VEIRRFSMKTLAKISLAATLPFAMQVNINPVAIR